ncbi:mRNA cleavage and polyadenylation factor subunit [Vermiconidia calcicola]|uniref:mRNA cleavage and polyadenylation factor subunit n=1 Tax=Vermiconidia calcicola TaxID=1690605 RepID=A0ACC3NCV1_9PEZI|nr:mRNA cleavage and polyadenylation factor subunit [Vermiconidia calcicola]
MQAYTELIPPSAVNHAVSLPFLDSKTKNLVIAKTCLLQIFSLKTYASSGNGPPNSASKPKLVLVGEYPVSGTVTSLASIKALNTKSGGDALLIAFKDAKLSLVEWDPDNHRISTISIHYYEGENISSQPFGPSLNELECKLTVDPSSRCAALRFGARHLAILPFRQHGDELMEGGEDGYDGELDVAPPSATIKRTQSGVQETLELEVRQTPYKSSFVLPLTALDPALAHPVDLAFLHEYREPTFGILWSIMQPSASLIEARKDILSYTVFTLDLEQRASTNLISVQKLPSDLWKVVPLPLPIGGALLVGTNEFVHVDQGGRTNAVAVNEYAKLASGFGMSDQSELNLKLEGCEIEPLDPKTGDLLIVLNGGTMAVLNFKLLGRNVGGLNVTRVTAANGGHLVEAAPSCVASFNGSRLFVGSEDGDSTVLAWTKPTATLSRKRSHAQMLGQEAAIADEEEGSSEEDDDDDLYANTFEPAKRTTSTTSQTSPDLGSAYQFNLESTLPSLGPINNVCFGRPPAMPKGQLELLAGVGRGRSSRLAIMNKEIVPEVKSTASFENAKNAWSICVKTNSDNESPENSKTEHDNLFFCYDGESTKIYDILPDSENSSSPQYTERSGGDFERYDETLNVSAFANGTRIMHCRRSEIRTYDAPDLQLAQIIPMLDEETDAELNIVHTSFCDPYLLVLREDSSIQILQVDEHGDLEPLDNSEAIGERKWLSGCLYAGELTAGETILCLLGEEGGLHLFDLPGLQPFYNIPTLSYLQAVLSPESPQRRVGAKDTLTEILFADLGVEDAKQPYLILRSAMDDLTLYEPWTTNAESWKTSLRFRKVPLSHIPKFEETAMEDGDGRPAPLQVMTVAKYATVCVPGPSPSLILKEPSSLPKVIGLRARKVRSLLPLHRTGCERGFGVLDESSMQECQLPSDADFGSGWCVQKLSLGDSTQEVRHIGFHDERQMYVVATCRDVDFHLPDEDVKHQDGVSLRPQVPQFTLQLLSARTRSIIHSYDMPYLETITSLKIMPLEVSEHTHEQKLTIVAGTAAQRGEDMPAKGAVNVFEILDVVPEPDRPESGVKLHLISREETRGAVTAIESFAGGLVGTAQGQKLMVRGLKEDGSCLPVAFLDAQCHTLQLKTFGSSGMWLAADAWKGLWFGGFTQEPYKLTTLGKSRTRMEVVGAEFLPFDGQLYLMVVDAEMDLHVLQYDPENPKSLSGTRLLHRSTFHLGQFPSSMTLLPSTLAPMSEQPVTNGETNGDSEADAPATTRTHAPSLFHILTTSQTGSIGLITPVDEATYRRLGSLQTHLTSVLEHAAGLNPRAYRAVESEGFGSRGVVDGSIVQRIHELGSARRAEVLARSGSDGWALRSDLEVIGGGGLGYL